MRFHLPALPGQPTTRANSHCAFTSKVRKWTRMMTERGHEVILYGSVENDAPATEHVPCIPTFSPPPAEPEHEDWRRANAKIAVQIEDRKEPGDFLCLPFGVCHRRLTELHPDLTAVETGIGYAGAFARHRIYESYAWMHVALGRQGHDPDGMDEWAVIPNYFETEDFPAGEPEDYLLYVGRMTERKGVHLAARVAEATGHDLILAGEGEEIPAYGDYIGPVGPDARANLMSHAKALVCPTRYVEPFGGVAVEAQLCGTPVITTDWGAFTETVEQGVSGYRCRTWADFLLAAANVAGLDRAEIRRRAQARWSLAAVAPQFESYFDRIEETA